MCSNKFCIVEEKKIDDESRMPRNEQPVVFQGQESESAVPKYKILLCSENVPPQVNGIARRVGHYASGLSKLGHTVDLLHPGCKGKVWQHVNPWNFSSLMMVLLPHHFVNYLRQDDYDIVHVVLPLNVSGMLLLVGFKLKRCLLQQSKPALVVSWHCNIGDYIGIFASPVVYPIVHFFFSAMGWVHSKLSDRILSPTKSSDPLIIHQWQPKKRGICATGVSLEQFDPALATSSWGSIWQSRKQAFLQANNMKFLILSVGRLSPEKSVDALLKACTQLEDCAVWVVGNGPHRVELEALTDKLNIPVQFWGYRHGDELHAVYSAADIFVCPSLTETFGQTVNEALAMTCRVALPSVPVFVEAYGAVVPPDAFWTPGFPKEMVSAIQTQLARHAQQDPYGQPDRDQLMTWDKACFELSKQYQHALQDVLLSGGRRQRQGINGWACLFLPIWCLWLFCLTIFICLYAGIRSAVGGSSVRYFLSSNIQNCKQRFQRFIQDSHPMISKLEAE
jgi:glycosyltransferase involved in cell wall biosynthesis